MRRHFVSGFPRALLSLSQEKSSGVEIGSVIIAGRGGGKGWGMMDYDFIIHVYDRNYLFFFSMVCIT